MAESPAARPGPAPGTGAGGADLAATGNAGLVSRVAAIVVDVLVLTVAVLVVGSLPTTAANAVLGDAPGWLVAGCAVVAVLLPWAYFTVCWWLVGESVGGLVLGVHVRRADGRRLSPLRAALRALVGLLLAPLWTVGLLGVLTDRRRRAWHDRVFGTVVRYADRATTGHGSLPVTGR